MFTFLPLKILKKMFLLDGLVLFFAHLWEINLIVFNFIQTI